MAFAIPVDLIALLRSASRVAVLTGAGVSQESGVPEPLLPYVNEWRLDTSHTVYSSLYAFASESGQAYTWDVHWSPMKLQRTSPAEKKIEKGNTWRQIL